MKSMMVRLFGFDLAGRREPALIRSFACSCLAATARFAPYLILVLITHGLIEGTRPPAAAWILVTLLVAFCVDWWLMARALSLSFTATYGLIADMRIGCADHLGRVPLGRIINQRGAVLSDLLTDRFSLYQDVATHLWWQIAATLPLPLMLWVLLLGLDWRIGLLVALFAPLVAATIPWSFRLLDRAAQGLIPARNTAAERVIELVEGAQDARLLDPNGVRLAATQEAIDALELRSVSSELAPAPAILLFGLLWWLALAVVTAVTALLWATGRADSATALVSLIVATRLCADLADLGSFVIECRFGRQVLGTIRSLAQEPVQAVAANPRVPSQAKVEIDGAFLSYSGKPALSGVTLTMPAGKTTAVVGPSGAGKSSLVALIGRLWDVERGSVRIGDVDVRDMAIETLNRMVSMVLQDVALFELTVEDNIRLGRPDAMRHEVIAAARAARIHERILALPHGYETRLTGSGIALSGGERQRLAIARAILKDSPIIVLDEATASIDIENEYLIREALANLTRNRTIIAVTHRLYTVINADQIAVLEQGRLTDCGPFDSLRARGGGLFNRLWREQEAAQGWRIGAG